MYANLFSAENCIHTFIRCTITLLNSKMHNLNNLKNALVYITNKKRKCRTKTLHGSLPPSAIIMVIWLCEQCVFS